MMPILNTLGGMNQKFHDYISGDSAENWFGREAFQMGNARNNLVLLLEIIGNASLFYFSCKVVKNESGSKSKVCVTLTNLYILGVCGKQAFLYLELLNRMSELFRQMWFLPLAMVLSSVKFSKLSSLQKIMYLSMFSVSYTYIKYLLAPQDGMVLFLWDNLNLS